MLIVDQSVLGGLDARLVAHLGAEEPGGNARLECARYLEAVAIGRGGCRALEGADLRSAPFRNELEIDPDEQALCDRLLDLRGRRYRLTPVASAVSIAQLRWCRCSSIDAERQPVSVRDVVGALESYEPVRSITKAALARRAEDDELSLTVLRAELRRLLESPIVLNRRLRIAVQDTVARGEVSMSQIATRCGRVKIDRRGHSSGETSWLARRLGVLPEAGHSAPTPWVHSDVLALIARDGLGISPREVEADAAQPEPEALISR